MNANKLIPVALLAVVFMFGCGKVKDKVNEETNSVQLKGHWLQKKSDHAGPVTNLIEENALVLSFKDDKVAFSPTDTGKGVIAKLKESINSGLVGATRPYKTENNDLVLPEFEGLEAKRVTVEVLEKNRLKFANPWNVKETWNFEKIDEETFNRKVAKDDRRP